MIIKDRLNEKNCVLTSSFREQQKLDDCITGVITMAAGKLHNMMKKMEDVLAAGSFAEEGESESARSLLNEGRRVLLAVKEGHVDSKTLKYAVNTAKRIGAQLDILYVAQSGSAEGTENGISNLESELITEGIAFRLISRSGCLKQAVIEYTNREKEVLFAVVESPNSSDADCNKKGTGLSELWQKLKCPLVVVMNEARA